jgi:hypothetical protein
MNNYKKYLKYKYKYYALKKQIGGGKVAITDLTVYNDSSLEPLEKKTYHDKLDKGFMAYSANDVLNRLQLDPSIHINKKYEPNISDILNTNRNHTGFIIETNNDLNEGITEFPEYRGDDKYVIYIKFKTKTNYTITNVFKEAPVRNTKYTTTILNTNQIFNDALKKILMGQPYRT